MSLEERARKAGAAGTTWQEFTYAACEEVAELDAAGVRVDTAALEAAWREGRREHRASTWIVRWTTAAVDYDQFGTETVERGEYHGKQLRKVLLDPNYAVGQIGRYHSGICGVWEEDPRATEARIAEQIALERAVRDAERIARAAGLEWLAAAPGEMVDGDDTALDEELRARGLTWADGREERHRRRAARAAEERAATWARCRAAMPDGATLIDPGSEGYRGFYGWVPGREPRAWRSIVVRPDHTCPDDAERALVIGEGNDVAGTLLTVADALAKGEMRIAGPDEHVPPAAVVKRIGIAYTDIVRAEHDGKVAWAGRSVYGDVLVLDDDGHIVRARALRQAAEAAYLAKRYGDAT